MRILLLVALATMCGVATATATAAAASSAGPSEMVLLTVSGVIGETNRGPLDPSQDSLLAAKKVDFPKAFAFDRPMLLSLEQGEVKAQPPGFDAPATFKGPLLREVLGRIEAAKMKITLLGLDGYAGWLLPEDVDRSDWILALEANGAPLGIGQQGPLWLINTRAEGEKPDDTGRRDWVWGVFYMKVEE